MQKSHFKANGRILTLCGRTTEFKQDQLRFWLSIYLTSYGQLFQQNSSRALQTSPHICTARPTIPILKSWETVFPSPSTQIHEKNFSACLPDRLWKLKATNRLHTQSPRKKKIRCLLPIGTWLPHSQGTFSSASYDATARDAARGRCTTGSHKSATTWVLNLVNPPTSKAGSRTTWVIFCSHINAPWS